MPGSRCWQSQFAYGPGRSRWKQVATSSGGTVTTTYIGGLLEKVVRGTLTEWRHQVATPSGLAAVYSRRSDGSADTYYLTTDHLGSTDRVLRAAGGTVQVAESFGAFGARRGSDWSGSPSTSDWTAIGNTTRRGFTGHEHLDNVNLIHMNGRVYDPVVGRFMSVDPVVDPGYSQDLNGYSYAWNIPLSVTDPSGWTENPLPVLPGITNCPPYCDAYRSLQIPGLVEFLERLFPPDPRVAPFNGALAFDEPVTLEEVVVRQQRIFLVRNRESACTWSIGNTKSLWAVFADNLEMKFGTGGTLYLEASFGLGRIEATAFSATMGYSRSLSGSLSSGYLSYSAPTISAIVGGTKATASLGSAEVRTAPGEWPSWVQPPIVGFGVPLTPPEVGNVGRVGGAIGFRYVEIGVNGNLGGFVTDAADYLAGSFECTR